MKRQNLIKYVLGLPIISIVCILGVLSLIQVSARNIEPTPNAPQQVHVAPPLRGIAEHRPQSLDRLELPRMRSQSDGLKAVAIVGDVGGHTATYKDDMDVAVEALQDHSVTVEKFYYGDSTFTWSDIVSASNGANFMLYMGHGVYWDGPCTQPTLVGGFSLGNEHVHPDDVRNDLAGQMANDSIVILSHVCFSAGDTACDESGEPSQDEAERRVKMYAAPFVDIGMEAYFANNYFHSAANIVNELLVDPASRKNVGDIFKSIYPYSSSQFRDLTYPDAPNYDLWLSGETGHWSYAFVGIPGYTFSGDTRPELGQLPSSLAFTYNTATTQLYPADHTLTPTNVGSDAGLTWNVTTAGDWFTVEPTEGNTPEDQITVTPVTPTIAGLATGHHTGAFTVTVTDPSNTLNGVQRVDLGLDVITPRMGGLPKSLSFTYFFSETTLIPLAHHVTPKNVGSDDTLSWQLAYSGDRFTIEPTSGETLDQFTIAPSELTITEAVTYTEVLTVSVTAPLGTEDPVQVISLSLRARPGGPDKVYVPLVMR